MYFILWLLFGGFVGWIASIFTHNNRRMGIVSNIIVGLVGSALGGWLASLLNYGPFNRFSLEGMLISIAGAVVLLTIINLFKLRR